LISYSKVKNIKNISFNEDLFAKDELPENGRSRSLYLSIRRGIKQIVITIGA
jgi:hypothetical protein